MLKIYTRSQQLAILAAQLLTQQANRDPRDEEGERALLSFFLACGVELVPTQDSLVRSYAPTFDQLKQIGALAPESLPRLPQFPAQFSPPLAFAAAGMTVVEASLPGTDYRTFTLREIEEVRGIEGGAVVLRVGISWYDQYGKQTTAKGLPMKNRTPYQVLESVTPEVYDQIERRELLHSLTGYTISMKGYAALADFPLEALRVVAILAERPQGALLLGSLPALFDLCMTTTSVSVGAFEKIEDAFPGAFYELEHLVDAVEDGCAALAELTGLPAEHLLLMLLETVCQRQGEIAQDSFSGC
jgi:hypothetical protein